MLAKVLIYIDLYIKHMFYITKYQHLKIIIKDYKIHHKCNYNNEYESKHYTI